MMPMKAAFTLIELLVVITIIVVLLALLTPALDKAIYQSELAVCAANLDAIATGAITYAAASQRRYPHRDVPRFGWENIRLSVGGQPESNRLDDRPMLRKFLTLNGHMRDPLTEQVDFDTPGPDTTVYANYTLWFSWRWLNNGDQGMYRLGDRFTWTEPGQSPVSFRLLASDWENVEPGANNLTFGSHPDKDGLMQPYVFDNEPSPYALALENATLSWWTIDGVERGATDVNFAYDDGSVARFNDLAWDDQERMTRVPDAASKGDTTNRWQKLPAN